MSDPAHEGVTVVLLPLRKDLGLVSLANMATYHSTESSFMATYKGILFAARGLAACIEMPKTILVYVVAYP
jgi:hypothetical protein